MADIRLRNMTSLYVVTDDAALCLYRVGSRVADHMYIGTAGGHFEPQELNDPKACVLREMQEETGLCEADLADMRLRYITHRLKNGEIRQNYYYFARLREVRELQSTEGTLHWVPFADIPAMEMPVWAKHMILHYINEGRQTDKVYAGITEESGTRFVPMNEF